MTEAKALLAAVLLFAAVEATGVLGARRPRAGDLLWLAVALAAGAAGHLVFPATGAFFPGLAVLLVVQALRRQAGLLPAGAGLCDRGRYLIVLAAAVLVRHPGITALALLAAGLSRRNLRFALLLLTAVRSPVRLSALDVDQILPPPVRYDRRRKEEGFAIVEAVVGLALVATISTALFLAAAGRTARLRQSREAATAREAAVSVLERLGAAPFEELAARDGVEFEVAGGGPGRVAVREREPGVLEVTVTAPRRGAAPVVLTTLRARRGP